MSSKYVSKRPNVPSPHVDPDDFPLVRGEIALWRAVIAQALTDSVSQNKNFSVRKDIREALAWLNNRSADFDAVCDMGMLDPEVTHKRCKVALARGCQWRLLIDQGWRAKAKAAMNESNEDYND